jgi:hypothetical protein
MAATGPSLPPVLAKGRHAGVSSPQTWPRQWRGFLSPNWVMMPDHDPHLGDAECRRGAQAVAIRGMSSKIF